MSNTDKLTPTTDGLISLFEAIALSDMRLMSKPGGRRDEQIKALMERIRKAWPFIAEEERNRIEQAIDKALRNMWEPF